MASQQPTDMEGVELPGNIFLEKAVPKAEAIAGAMADFEEGSANSPVAVLRQKEGQLLLQEGLVEEAKEAYTAGLKLDGEAAIKVKLLAGLASCFDLSGENDQAENYFTQALITCREGQFPIGLTWIVFHGGADFVSPGTLSKEEAEVLKGFARKFLYSQPQQSLAASKWLINYSGENKECVVEGHISAGLVYRDWGQFDRALDHFYLAQEQGEQHGFGSKSKYWALLNIAAVHDMHGQRQDFYDIIEEVIKNAGEDQDDWALAYALKDLGIHYQENENFEQAEHYLKRSIPIMKKLNDQRGLGVCYSNLGYVYVEQKQYELAKKNLDDALVILQATNYDQLYASSLLVKSNLYGKLGEWEESKRLALEGLSIARRINASYFVLDAFQLLMEYYMEQGNLEMIENYVDSLLSTKDEYAQQERLYESEKLKVRYDIEKKEEQLAIQKELNTSLNAKNLLQKRQRNTLLFILFLGLVVVLLFYNRYQLQQSLDEEGEKRNALEKQRLEEKVNHKQRELASLTLQMVQKNDLLQQLEESLKNIKKNDPGFQKEMVNLKKMIQTHQSLDEDWSDFKTHFEGVHPGFFDRLRTQIDKLSPQDERHCSYLKMGLSTKEIARLMNISPTSVQMARYRLKKKLQLGKDDDIYQYINDL
ncbi:LuxR C-terminal-related transcriptional regulator [Lewinella cohaerens]|uniref:LuxR C-terminal-related transcriptional regulator n=1 Tax=Lewinella cohaerens TaxID=70995 RepID=UPI00035DB9D9|nr:tetratricopeptide repeat protein [Lewinella cohaerens]